MSPYQISKRNFDQFIEESTDRLKLIVHDSITVVYDKNFIHFSDICSVGYKKNSLVPVLFVKKELYTKTHVEILMNICKNLQEIFIIFKEFTIRFNHLTGFFLKIDDSNQLFKIYKEVYTDLVKFRPHELDDMMIFVKNIKGKPLYIKLDYGNSKKHNVDMFYLYEDNDSCAVVEVYHAVVPKTDFIDSISYQLSSGKTLIPNE